MEDTQVDINYKKAFNQGYWLQIGDPSVFKEFISTLKDTNSAEYRGYLAGAMQADTEILTERLKAARKNGRGR